MRTHTRSRHVVRPLGAALVLLTAATPTFASMVWFDETGGGGGYATFGNLVSAYHTFLGTPDATIDLNDLAQGTVLGSQYAGTLGVTFTNTSLGRYASYSRIQLEGGAIAEDITGYDGTYMSNGDKVFVKFDNEYSETPFTITFADPVSTVGAFVGMGVQGAVHDLRISLYDAGNTLIGQRVVTSWLWEADAYKQNYESFFAVHADTASIGRIEILNLATADFANALILDNLSFGRGGAVTPEPATMLAMMAGFGVAAVATRRRTRC